MASLEVKVSGNTLKTCNCLSLLLEVDLSLRRVSSLYFRKWNIEIKYCKKKKRNKYCKTHLAQNNSSFFSIQSACITFFLSLINHKVSTFEFKKYNLIHIIFSSWSSRLNLSKNVLIKSSVYLTLSVA